LILWGGELPPDLDLEAAAARFAALEVIVVRGKRDKLITEKTVAGIVRRLERHKVRHRVVEFEGGHEIDGAVLGEIAAEDGGRR
jgi:predicted esterase